MDPSFDDVLNYDIHTIQLNNGHRLRFRYPPGPTYRSKRLLPKQNSSKRYYNEELWEDDYEDDDELDMVQNEDGSYSLELNVPKILHGSVIGLKGAVKRKLESETNTEIQVPQKDDFGPIIVNGLTQKNVIKCKLRIDMTLMDARFKQQFTHFISIPMTDSQIQDGFKKFKAKVLNLGNIRGIDESIFQNSFKLHLTIGTLILGSEEVNKVANLLLKLKENVVDPLIENMGPFQITMKGLEYMNDDPSEIDVLYAKVKFTNDENNLLQRISDELIEYLADEGLTFKKYDRVKLHVTLMNTLFRKDKEGLKYNMENEYDKKFRKERETFDGLQILDNEELRKWDFGKQEFKEIHLSIRKSTARNCYYKSAYVQEF